eukprot:scaffold1833_cov263-Chaetoceros_neogracile.AAC.2
MRITIGTLVCLLHFPAIQGLITVRPSSIFIKSSFALEHRRHSHYPVSTVPSVSSSSLSSSSLQSTSTDSAKAGEDGYSLLRQPLTWDSSTDPTFKTPSSLDETKESSNQKNQDWFQQNYKQPSKSQRQDDDHQDATMNHPNSNSNAGTNVNGNGNVKQQEGEFQQEVNLFQRTMETLDYPIVLQALLNNCETIPAQQIVMNSMQSLPPPIISSKKSKSSKSNLMGGMRSMQLTAGTRQEIHERYAAVKEMALILKGDAEIPKSSSSSSRSRATKVMPPPMQGRFDLSPMWETVDGGGVLDGPDILEVETILKGCLKVYEWCKSLELAELWVVPGYEDEHTIAKEGKPAFVQLPKYANSIYVDEDLLDLLETAFDDEGRLSGSTFQGVGRLRNKIRVLKTDILSTLDTLMTSPSVKSKISMESGGALYSEVNGRIVIPIAEKYANSVGIVHDVSRSGKTAYIEPSEIVRPTNEMNQAIMELQQEEGKVWRMLTTQIMENQDDIDEAIAVVAQLDLVLARIRLGDRIAGVIPEVGDEGVISLKDAKHPVLLLRELKEVVGSDIDLGAGDNQGLVLTGPNSGGKTVILKLLGLCALMARDGIPIPAQPDGARVDFFGPVLADIGDIQSVDDDLSTFSGHMLVCREVLANSGKNALVLMDELGSGTDPNQGVAIAQSILEALLATGSRVAITTHYLQLKQLAASDDRFAVGAMQFVNGKPSYKLLPGVVGESFALSVAERLKLPQYVIDRASELMDSDTKQMGDLIRNMEDQKALIDEQAMALENKKRELEQLEQDMKKQQQKLEREQLNARRDEAAKFAKKLEEKERVLEEVLQKLKADPSKKMIARSWDEIKFVRRDALMEAENVPSVLRKKKLAAAEAAEQFAEMVPISEMREKPDLNAGDTLVICKKGAMSGKEATIINTSGKKVTVSVQGMQMSMKLAEVALPPRSFVVKKATEKREMEGKNTMSKMARKALDSEQRDFTAGAGSDTVGKKSSGSIMRLSSNTIDCLGCNFEEARRKCEDKFSKVMMNKNPVVYILHGHGATGILKQKIRDWLKREKQFVKKFGAADAADGGDAFTKVELKTSLL